jgi:hypothetical protein
MRINKEDTAFASHITNSRYKYGKVDDIMDMREKAESGKIVNKWRKFPSLFTKKLSLLI